MAHENPLWMQDLGYSARRDRHFIELTWDEGVLGGFAIVQATGMNIGITRGAGIIDGDDQENQGSYKVATTALEELEVPAAPGSNSRIDRVVYRVNDPNAGSVATPTGGLFEVLQGEPGSSPSPPAEPNTAITLGFITVAAGTVAINVTTMVQDVRVYAGRKDVPGSRLEVHHSHPINGYLPEDGAAVSRTEFSELFDAIGTTFGAGDGSTTFNVPDTRGRGTVVASNLGTSAGNATGNGRITTAIHGTGGSATVTLTTAQMPSHNHTQNSHNHSQNSHTHTQSNHNHGSGSLATANDGGHFHSSGTLSTSTTGSHTHNTPHSNARWMYGANAFVQPGGATTQRYNKVDAGDVMVWRETNSQQFPPTNAGSHNHNISGNTGSVGSHNHNISGSTAGDTANINAATATNNATTATNNPTGGGEAHTNTQPHLAVYGWIRT